MACRNISCQFPKASLTCFPFIIASNARFAVLADFSASGWNHRDVALAKMLQTVENLHWKAFSLSIDLTPNEESRHSGFPETDRNNLKENQRIPIDGLLSAQDNPQIYMGKNAAMILLLEDFFKLRKLQPMISGGRIVNRYRSQ